MVAVEALKGSEAPRSRGVVESGPRLGDAAGMGKGLIYRVGAVSDE